MRRIAAAIVLLAATVTVVAAREPGRALGPVIAITRTEVAVESLCCVGHVELSGRGEAGAVREDEVSDVAFVQFDAAGAEPMEDGVGIGVSGNGCTAVRAIDAGSVTVARVVDRCNGTNRQFAIPDAWSRAAIAVTFDGRFAALQYRQCIVGIALICFESALRLDTSNGALAGLPAGLGQPAGYEFGLDIDDGGNLAVLPITNGSTIVIGLWNVSAGTVTPLTPTGTGRWSAFPSISGNGQFVSFASNQARGLGESGSGPWVYVVPASGGAGRLASPAAGVAYHSSLTNDATQVAYAVSNGFDPPVVEFVRQQQDCGTVPPDSLTYYCPPARIDVAFGPAPGLATGVQTETVSLDAAQAISGRHTYPALSGNGRWVAWISQTGDSLMGQDLDLNGNSHAFMRRRDPNLLIDAVSFPVITVNTVADVTTTVRNTGRTSVWIDQITPSPGVFSVIGGTCAPGMSLGPGATCTVALRYAPGASPGTTTGTLVVGEVGYDAVSAVRGLSGTATQPPTISTTTVPGTTTTSTTVPGQVTTTTTTPPGQVTTTTRPGSPSLSATPNPVEFGAVAVGFASDPAVVTVSNGGGAAGLIQTSLGGAHPDDFWVRTNDCVGVTLAVGANCGIEVLLIPRGGGIRTATLTIRSGSSVVNVTLSGVGTFQPRLVPMPSTITEHGISTIYGQGFPPGETFTVTVVETGLTLQGTADATGLFRALLPASGNLVLGAYTLHVDAVPNTFEDVESTLLVALGTFRPQGEGGPAFGNSNLIVARGG
jgi:hypothetical protein